jgi:hypothetical protein
MEAVCCSETLVSIPRYYAEDQQHLHCREKIKSHINVSYQFCDQTFCKDSTKILTVTRELRIQALSLRPLVAGTSARHDPVLNMRHSKGATNIDDSWRQFNITDGAPLRTPPHVSNTLQWILQDKPKAAANYSSVYVFSIPVLFFVLLLHPAKKTL